MEYGKPKGGARIIGFRLRSLSTVPVRSYCSFFRPLLLPPFSTDDRAPHFQYSSTPIFIFFSNDDPFSLLISAFFLSTRPQCCRFFLLEMRSFLLTSYPFKYFHNLPVRPHFSLLSPPALSFSWKKRFRCFVKRRWVGVFTVSSFLISFFLKLQSPIFCLGAGGSLALN